MKPWLKNVIFFLIIAGFLYVDFFFIIDEGEVWFNVLPIVLAFLVWVVFSIDKALLLIGFLVPLSVPLVEFYPDLFFNIDLPTEPIFVLFLCAFLYRLFVKKTYDTTYFHHPVCIVVLAYLAWRLVTVIFSTLPLVSLKYWIASLWFICPFLFLLLPLFREEKNIRIFLIGYIISLVPVIIYTLSRHLGYHFNQEAANYVCNPFYKDHTSYGAALAMFIPVNIGLLFLKEMNRWLKLLLFLVLCMLLVGIVFSYTRAAWVSIGAAIATIFVLRWELRPKTLFLLLIAGIVILIPLSNNILVNLSHNRQDSSSNFTEHIQSISNVQTDASNLERINRWHSAIRMFKERPIFGWGPGTYQFNYAPFQSHKDKTIISTNSGNMGNAHSEYIGNLAESGLLGSLGFVLICIMIYVTGMRAYKNTQTYNAKVLIMSVLCGISTYFVHGAMNNFLDIDKIAVPFWGFAAILVILDVLSSNKNEHFLSK